MPSYNIQTLYDIGIDITPEMDGGVYGAAVSDCVCKGIGNDFQAITEENVATIAFAKDSQAIIGGSFFRLLDRCVIDLSNHRSETFNLYAKIDKGNTSGPRGTFSIRSTSETPANDNLNNTEGGVREMLLYTITTNESGVPTSVVDKRTMKENGAAAFGGHGTGDDGRIHPHCIDHAGHIRAADAYAAP